MTDDELADFVDNLQKWHKDKVDQLNLIIKDDSFPFDFGGVKLEADSDKAEGVRVGVKIALHLLGKLPFSVNVQSDNEDHGLEE